MDLCCLHQLLSVAITMVTRYCTHMAGVVTAWLTRTVDNVEVYALDNMYVQAGYRTIFNQETSVDLLVLLFTTGGNRQLY